MKKGMHVEYGGKDYKRNGKSLKATEEDKRRDRKIWTRKKRLGRNGGLT